LSLKRILFVCSRNQLRSPTAEQIFASHDDLEVASAGTDPACGNPVTAEMVEDADLIFVMEKAHRTRLQRQFRTSLKRVRVVCLDIPDVYDFMDEDLIRILKTRVSQHLR
jgi:predicted protein tyrosine phosphatase